MESHLHHRGLEGGLRKQEISTGKWYKISISLQLSELNPLKTSNALWPLWMERTPSSLSPSPISLLGQGRFSSIPERGQHTPEGCKSKWFHFLMFSYASSTQQPLPDFSLTNTGHSQNMNFPDSAHVFQKPNTNSIYKQRSKSNMHKSFRN